MVNIFQISVINFNYRSFLNYHQYDTNSVSNAPYLQFQNTDGDLTMMGGGYGSKHHIGSKLHLHHHHHHHHGSLSAIDQQNQQQINGSNSNIPWRHRQCPSIGSSSSSTSITR